MVALSMQLAQSPVQQQLLLREADNFSKVAAALGVGDLGTQIALALLHALLLNLLQCTGDFLFGGRAGFAQQSLGKEGPLAFVLDYFHRVADAAGGKGLQGRTGG